ncbi:MAG TPA: FmdB family zinc ribbon protein [Ktedonobacterales bacterium]|jgi:putative FmdB family regulatory protein|nr:FmdB family zinc ribbon protein [Ktedonobacterales bacterium]
MPMYEYACQSCGARFEVRQTFTDDPLAICPTCGGPIHRVLYPASIVFKGGGFYSTDNRHDGSFAAASADASAATSDAKSDPKADTKVDSKSESKTKHETKHETPAAGSAPASSESKPSTPAAKE